MELTLLLGAAVLGLGISISLGPLLVRLGKNNGAPVHARDLHHTHSNPVPRLGGVALAAAFLTVGLVAMFVQPNPRLFHARVVVLAGGLAMFLLGLLDDLKPIGARKKLFAQICLAAAVCYFGIRIEILRNPLTGSLISLGLWGGIITVFWLVSITNLINLIDGTDGLAGGISLMLMALLAYVASSTNGLCFTAAGMAGALIGFLYFNFPPAKIYLGDGGAYLLGFSIGMLSIVSSNKGTIAAALIAPLFVLTLPIVDTALAILRRGLRGLPIFRPDRRHIHHHLVGSGFSRKKVVLSIYCLTLIFLLMALGVFWSQGRLLPILLGGRVMTLLVCAGIMNFSREWFAVGRVLGNSLEMRHEVQHAVALTRWFEMHSLHAESIEHLWSDYRFVVEKLGFARVRLVLEDGERSWQLDGFLHNHQSCRSARYELGSGKAGTLEFVAAKCAAETRPGKLDRPVRNCGKPVCPCASYSRLFDVLSELAADGWLRAADKWQKHHATSILFASKAGAPLPKPVNGASQPSLLGFFKARKPGKNLPLWGRAANP